MQIRVLFFGVLKDLSGKASDSLSLPENATLGDVLSHYEQIIPRLKETASSLAMSVNQEYAGPCHPAEARRRSRAAAAGERRIRNPVRTRPSFGRRLTRPRLCSASSVPKMVPLRSSRA